MIGSGWVGLALSSCVLLNVLTLQIPMYTGKCEASLEQNNRRMVVLQSTYYLSIKCPVFSVSSSQGSCTPLLTSICTRNICVATAGRENARHIQRILQLYNEGIIQLHLALLNTCILFTVIFLDYVDLSIEDHFQ